MSPQHFFDCDDCARQHVDKAKGSLLLLAKRAPKASELFDHLQTQGWLLSVLQQALNELLLDGRLYMTGDRRLLRVGNPMLGNDRATGNASGNTESDGNPVTSDQEPVT